MRFLHLLLPALQLRGETKFAPVHTSNFCGSVDSVGTGGISGWIANKEFPARPVFLKLRVGNLEVHDQAGLARPDVPTFMPGAEAAGFRVNLPQAGAHRLVSVYASDKRQGPYQLIKFVWMSRRREWDTSPSVRLSPKEPTHLAFSNGALKFAQFGSRIRDLKSVLTPKSSVAVVVWDCAHNPVGRAICIAEAIKSSGRSVVIVAYQIQDFGADIWEPIRQTDQPLLAVPWKHRALYFALLGDLKGCFSTVVICKDRYPSMELAATLLSEDTRVVMDIDDNELAFMQSSESLQDRAYGLIAWPLTRSLLRTLTVRTAPSISLKEAVSASVILRHCRKSHQLPLVANKDELCLVGDTLRVCFLGTVRAHKNIVELARRVDDFRGEILNGKIKFTVAGDVPEIVKSELESIGVSVLGIVPFDGITRELAKHDLVITGYSFGKQQKSITDYQISSKIGDALSVGIPCLTPLSAATADLVDIPGVYLFTESTFKPQFIAATYRRPKLELPFEFSLEGGYTAFSYAESLCEERGCIGKNLLAAPVWSSLPSLRQGSSERKNNLILIWKQYDAGIYGRRIDQIARARSSAEDGGNVFIFEFIPAWDFEQISGDDAFSSDALLKADRLQEKTADGGLRIDGCIYKAFIYTKNQDLQVAVSEFLMSQQLSPCNTSFLLFPLIRELEHLWPLIREYRYAVDVVDNQVEWNPNSAESSAAEAQLRDTFAGATFCVTNNASNQKYLSAFCTGGPRVSLVANWYSPPSSSDSMHLSSTPSSAATKVKLVYSGNLNDRVDWALLCRLMDLVGSNVELWLIGSVRNDARRQLQKVLDFDNVIYCGPRMENETLKIMRDADYALVPHVRNQISRFMDPLKIEMYRYLGLTVLATRVAGVEPDSGLIICDTADDFATSIRQKLSFKGSKGVSDESFQRKDRYLQLLESL